MTWGSPIWLYLWLAGMAGGAYLAAFLVDRFSGGQEKALLKLATLVGTPLAIIGVLLLIVDLGVPLRFWRLMVHFDFSSAMSMGTWILIVWVIAAVVMLVVWFGERFIPSGLRAVAHLASGVCSWVAAIFAVLLIAYTGVLLASSNQALWAATYLIPCLFVASAVSTGVALVLITALIRRDGAISAKTLVRLSEADVVIIIIEMAIMVGYCLWLGVSAMGGAAEGLKLLVAGSFAPAFWVGVVLLALLIPLGLELSSWGKELQQGKTGLAIMVASACVILGGLILRAVIVTGGQVL